MIIPITSFGLERNPHTLKGKEQIEWIIENVKPEIYQGIPSEGDIGVRSENSGRIDTSRHFARIYNLPTGILIGTLRSQCWWICDSSLNVQSFGVSEMSAIPGAVPTIGHASLGGAYWALPHNVRISITGEFVAASGYYSVIQVYNLHGSGTYEYRVFE